ncbi:hypothetical protein DPMN_097251 [Dreissena polymorpha]|uniref:Uncharacterized protein n=1 Tax=Dreissena polymorpha TaxID=45954 RepID=A0A9D4LBG6_DREPO|nr:hypothetical protein DPMN_097251 [Dreissena polymorpha]
MFFDKEKLKMHVHCEPSCEKEIICTERRPARHTSSVENCLRNANSYLVDKMVC